LFMRPSGRSRRCSRQCRELFELRRAFAPGERRDVSDIALDARGLRRRLEPAEMWDYEWLGWELHNLDPADTVPSIDARAIVTRATINRIAADVARRDEIITASSKEAVSR
jgi:hypothetical protein